MNLELMAFANVPEIVEGDDLGELLAHGGEPPVDGDIFVVAQKIVSKAEGRTVALAEIAPGAEAVELARRSDKDPRLVQLILDESNEVLRATAGVIIVETCHGFICANAGIDASNVPGEETVLQLPVDADASAARMRARVRALTGACVAVIVSDSFGRAWRVGQQDIAVGCAGIEPVIDLRGETDREGRELTATVSAVADELASAANLARTKASGEPVVLVRGKPTLVTEADGPGALALLRARNEDLFR